MRIREHIGINAQREPPLRFQLASALGKQLQRVLDRRAQLLQGRAPLRPRLQAGVDRVGQLARQVGTEAAQAAGAAADRPCREEPTITVREAFAREQPSLLPLPDNPYPCELQLPVKVGKTPYARFDLNDYSVPHTHVQRTLTVRADQRCVRILDGADVVAEHARSYDRGAQIELAAHIDALAARKREARQHRGLDHLARAAPAAQTLMLRAAEGGGNLGNITAQLLRLLDRYGAAELQAAIEETLASGAAPHQNPVRLALERRRAARGAPPPVAIALPEHVRDKDQLVTPHQLAIYDQLTTEDDDDDQD